MSYQLQSTAQFKKDCRRMKRRGLDLNELNEIIGRLQKGEELPPEKRDHELVGEFAGFRECHIRPDWLLVYYICRTRLVLVCVRTGTHSDIFG